MNLQILKNKFVIAIPVGLLLLGCLHKFNQYKTLDNTKSDEEKKKEKDKYNTLYYIKSFLVCYIIGLVLIILLKKGYKYYTENIKSKSKIENNNVSNIETKPLETMESVIDNTTLPNNDLKINKPISTPSNTVSNNVENSHKIEELDLDLDLDLDTDTSGLEEISLPKVDKNAEKLKKKKALLAKRKKLLELKKQKALEKKTTERNNNLALETFNTGTPNF